jgi:hypothetical protein
MHTLLRRLRGTLGTALTWAIGWSIVGLLVSLTDRNEMGALMMSPRHAFWTSMGWAVIGAISGSVFSLCIATDGRKQIAALSPKRVVMWGVVAAVVLPFGFEVVGRVVNDKPIATFMLKSMMLFAATGAACAYATFRLAIRPLSPELAKAGELLQSHHSERLELMKEFQTQGQIVATGSAKLFQDADKVRESLR